MRRSSLRNDGCGDPMNARLRLIARHFTFVLTCSLFAGFLLLPGFVESVQGDDTRTLGEGFGMVTSYARYSLWVLITLRTSEFYLFPFSLANLAFFALPILHFTSYARRPWPNQVLRWVFFIGGCGFLKILWELNQKAAFPAYFWMMAAMAAVEYLALSLPLAVSQPAVAMVEGTR